MLHSFGVELRRRLVAVVELRRRVRHRFVRQNTARLGVILSARRPGQHQHHRGRPRHQPHHGRHRHHWCQRSHRSRQHQSCESRTTPPGRRIHTQRRTSLPAGRPRTGSSSRPHQSRPHPGTDQPPETAAVTAAAAPLAVQPRGRRSSSVEPPRP